MREIPIERARRRRGGEGLGPGGGTAPSPASRSAPMRRPAATPAFDVTPARLVTGLITERGVCEASEQGLRGLFPESAAA